MMQEQDYQTATNEELLEEFVKTRDGKLKKEIVLRYSYIVKSIAVQMRGVYVSFAEMDDIINEGIIALMTALDKFDPEKNVKFSSYASLRVRGAVIDLARKQDWIPRSIRKFSRQLDDAANELYIKLGRPAEDEEIAAHMGLDYDKYQKNVSKTGLQNLLSLDALLDETQSDSMMPVDSNIDNLPTEHLKRKELYEMLKGAIAQLRPKEQLVISLYYRKGLNMKEIARVLEISEPRVSQIQSGALRRMRKILESYVADGHKEERK